MTTPARLPGAPAPLAADDLRLSLGGRRVVAGVSLVFAAGTWTAVVGPNGAGKSTLLALLAGLRRPDAGRVYLDGQPLDDVPTRERARTLAWLAQQGLANGDLTARDVVRLGRLPHHGLFGAPGPADEAAVEAAMAETACTAFAARRLGELSGGERQRVLLARALAGDAGVLLLDEPAAHLDAPHQRALVHGVRERARRGAAVVTVLHELGLALAADRIVVLAAGRVRADATPADAALRATLVEVFDHAFTIELVVRADGAERWAVLPAA